MVLAQASSSTQQLPTISSTSSNQTCNSTFKIGFPRILDGDLIARAKAYSGEV
jgi:hypothetical protein